MKQRLDSYVCKTYGISRNRAQMCIREGSVLIDGSQETSCGFLVPEDAYVELLKSDLGRYVSRSALKLKYFLDNHQEIDVSWKVCLDVGASTGGFTQVLLERWVKRIYAIDVGTDQLHPTVKNDQRVVSLEWLDVRSVTSKQLPVTSSEFIDFVTVDVSFISLTKILDDLVRIAREFGSSDGVQMILLWKPQFEVGRANLTKKWVVKDEKIRDKFLMSFVELLNEKGFTIVCHEPSRLSGEEGNVAEIVWVREGESVDV